MNARRGLAQTLHWVGNLELREKRHAEAGRAFAETLESARRIGDRVGEALGLQGLGVANLRLGLMEEAGESLRSSP
ncbi:tetratricopeptide repeat protein [Nonomuraea sp. NPDC049725]|uniref:tetratricopeptide repeat protein n=1 Tax=Nonomuraea sp. NPDC049725 TaxID=3154508 RepID=UPI003421FE53